eukprot:CAMPEP_0206235124 /NCGR_PEP_ID=MMETSP0047_2-20121206/12974_1 /ASSEMBLY_ACC=CAM_ASM_000192 /TAXON_ID=195065 /ORGANISM="Chroomonas mesostigmatica_cf, Strain CCMP1168" /LENGTH=395 /DNA_ID=CAMNT_0053659291 /DNA_START=105 /DNA_END=1293 /DNA_ORIENTATION=+
MAQGKLSVKQSRKRAMDFKKGILPRKPRSRNPETNQGAVTCEIIAETRWNASTKYHLRMSTFKGACETRGKEYGDFELLYKRVKAKYSMVPAMPSKTIGTDEKKSMRVDRLRRGMEKFVNNLLSRADSAGDADLCVFIRLHPEVTLHGLGGKQEAPKKAWYVEHLEENGTIMTESSRRASKASAMEGLGDGTASGATTRTSSLDTKTKKDKETEKKELSANRLALQKRLEGMGPKSDPLSPASHMAIQFAMNGGLLAKPDGSSELNVHKNRGRSGTKEDKKGKRSSSSQGRAKEHSGRKCKRSMSDAVGDELATLQQLQQEQLKLSQAIAKTAHKVQEKMYKEQQQEAAKQAQQYYAQQGQQQQQSQHYGYQQVQAQRPAHYGMRPSQQRAVAVM